MMSDSLHALAIEGLTMLPPEAPVRAGALHGRGPLEVPWTEGEFVPLKGPGE